MSIGQSNIAIGVNANGGLQIFARGVTGTIYTAAQPNAGGSFSSWTTVGTNGFTALSGIAVARNTDGRLEVFACSNQNLVSHCWETAPGNNTWSQWSNVSDPQTAQSSPVARANLNGALEVFAIDTNGYACTSAQPYPNPGGSGPWTAWQPVGGSPVIGNLGLGINADGRLEILARNAQGIMQNCWQNMPDGAWSNWDVTGNGFAASSDAAVCLNVTDRLEAFAVDSHGAVWTSAQGNVGAGPWTNWTSTGGATALNPTAARNANNNPEAFICTTAGVPQNLWPLGNGWSAWSNLGTPTTTVASPVYVGQADNNGPLHAFAFDSAGAVLTCAQQAGIIGPWSGWTSLGVPGG